MSAQNKVDPFHVNRDSVNDNALITRRLRVANGADILATQYASIVTNAESTVAMPFLGTINVTVTAGTGDVQDVINVINPFITADMTNPSKVSVSISNNGAGATGADYDAIVLADGIAEVQGGGTEVINTDAIISITVLN